MRDQRLLYPPAVYVFPLNQLVPDKKIGITYSQRLGRKNQTQKVFDRTSGA